ncbi:MAG: hypothetical protein QG577_2121 [Thermodesulfobacteriota bacterium]|nr:hypothetical protein [Thermodesulfobacteriota bacterium]
MCGICGLIDYSGVPIDPDVLRSMTRSLKHRGPNDEGVSILGFAGLGHTRLSILDLTSAGHQPMHSEGKGISIVYNGEIYNFKLIREQLQDHGVRFRSRSDTEVVLEAFARWDTNCFEMFNGMFAVAIWDQNKNRLILARDRFGIKPLYYSQFQNGLVFGSEIKAILASNRIDRTLDYTGLHEYLWFGATLGITTLFDGIKKVLPGTYLVVDAHGTHAHEYWKIEETGQVHDPIQVVVPTVRDKLEEAVRDHLVSDVSVGVFLSGGIDSSSIVALAGRHYEGRLTTYSVGFDYEGGVNELPKARSVAKTFGTDHHELHVVAQNVPEVLDRLVEAHDQPFGDAANIPLFLMCENLPRETKVILQGDGGDEIFGGYRRYSVLVFETFWRIVATILRPAIQGEIRFPWVQRLVRFLLAIGERDPGLRMALLLTGESANSRPVRVLSPDVAQLVEQRDPFGRYRDVSARTKHLDPVQRMLYTDCSILLPDIYCEKVDRATMAHGIEVRVPFLDKNLAEYALGIPARLKVRWGKKKWMMRSAMRGIVPDSILDSPKTGFGVPFEYWLRKPLVPLMKEVFNVRIGGGLKLFDEAALQKILDEHVSGIKDNGFLLWKVLNLGLWYKKYF